MLGMCSVVGLEKFCEEEDSMGLGWCKDGGFASAHLKWYLNIDIVIG